MRFSNLPENLLLLKYLLMTTVSICRRFSKGFYVHISSPRESMTCFFIYLMASSTSCFLLLEFCVYYFRSLYIPLYILEVTLQNDWLSSPQYYIHEVAFLSLLMYPFQYLQCFFQISLQVIVYFPTYFKPPLFLVLYYLSSKFYLGIFVSYSVLYSFFVYLFILHKDLVLFVSLLPVSRTTCVILV